MYAQVPAGDLLAQEDALISAVAAAPRRGMNPSVYRSLVQYIGAQRQLNEEAVTRLPAAQRTPFLALAAPGGPMSQVAAIEDDIIKAGPGAKRLPFPVASWRTAYDTTDKVTSGAALEYISLVVSLVLSVRMVRSLLGDIGRLKTSAHNLTDDRLRDVVGRLRRGETVDVTTGTARPVFVNPEMAEPGAAFGALQHTAVELAAANERLNAPLDVTTVDSTRLGPITVGRPARRHTIEVVLRRSPYGGVSAVVLGQPPGVDHAGRGRRHVTDRRRTVPGTGPGRPPRTAHVGQGRPGGGRGPRPPAGAGTLRVRLRPVRPGGLPLPAGPGVRERAGGPAVTARAPYGYSVLQGHFSMEEIRLSHEPRPLYSPHAWIRNVFPAP
ncbi:nitrate- and nitrite sensing domain-containing protein [Streptomyces tendae]